MFITLFALSFFPFLLGHTQAAAGPKANVLIVTGGHDFDQANFLEMFGQFEGVSFTHVVYGQGAEEKLNPAGAKEFDAIVFYDMHQDKEPQWKGIDQLLSEGKGIVFLHHSLWSYDGTWPEYRDILGGRASSKEKVAPEPSPTSTYLHGEHIRVHIADASHPVTRGLRDFEIMDETYNHYWVDPNVHVLLTTDNPTSERAIAWSHTYKKSRIVYVELGHDRSAYEDRNYRTLLRQAIFWVANR
jgi:type 1 glutamine amidotransferase